jgi:hypothetical protein
MFTVLLRFTLIGPFFGGGVFFAAIAVEAHDVSTIEKIASTLVSFLGLSVLASFVSMLFGFIPAAASGVFYWYVLSRMKRNLVPLLRIVCGGGIGFFVSALYGWSFSFDVAPFPPPIDLLLPWAMAGAAAGAISALSIRDATYAVVFPPPRET